MILYRYRVTHVSSLWRSITFLTFFQITSSFHVHIQIIMNALSTASKDTGMCKFSWYIYSPYLYKIILMSIGCKYITIVQSNHSGRASWSAYSNGCTTNQSSYSCLLFVIYRSIGPTSYKTICHIKNFISPSSLKWR